MRYFKLQLKKPDGKLFFKTDFQIEHVTYLVSQLAAVLVQRGIFREGDAYEARIIPKSDNTPKEQPVILKKSDITDNGSGVIDLLFEDSVSSIESITYLTAQVSAQESDDVYRFDIHPSAILLPFVLRNTMRKVLDEGILKDGDHFQIHLSAYAEGEPKIDPILAVQKLVVTTPEEQGEIEVSVLSDAEEAPIVVDTSTTGEEEIEITIGEVEELIKPGVKSITDYADAEQVGQVSEKDVPIFFRRGARQQAFESAKASAKAKIEVGGFLLGSVFHDPETHRVFVEVSEAVETDAAKGTAGSLDFHYEAWRQVLDRIAQDFPDKIPVGWYHTHLVSDVVALPVEGTENEYVARYVPLFSSQDRFIHRNFFPDPWHVALVVDLCCGYDIFFAWQEGMIMPTRGFYLYGD